MLEKAFYSPTLKRFFKDEEQGLKEEKEFQEKTLAETKAKEEKTKAYKKYLQLRSDFIKKYGVYHMTLSEKDLPTGSLFDLFDHFFW